MCESGAVGIGLKRYENDGSVLDRHPGRGYTGDGVVHAVDALPSGHFFSRLVRYAGKR